MALKKVLMLVLFGFVRLSSSVPKECLLPFPRSYVAYSLKEHEKIDIDGKLDEDAWKNVGWTEEFIGKHHYSNTLFFLPFFRF